MTSHEWAATFGSICLLAAAALAVWAFCRFVTEELGR